MQKTIIFLFFIILFSCQGRKKQQVQNKTSDITYSDEPKKKEELQQYETLSIDSLWNIVVHKKGCLTGGQYVKNGKFGNEGCIMTTTTEWSVLLNKPKDNLTNFLLEKLNKKDTTSVHTCPFFLATEGELAVYTLQAVHKKNWFEFKPFRKYIEKVNDENNFKLLGSRNSYQGYLNDSILSNRKNLEIMKKMWEQH